MVLFSFFAIVAMIKIFKLNVFFVFLAAYWLGRIGQGMNGYFLQKQKMFGISKG
jgi:hypothetical protein